MHFNVDVPADLRYEEAKRAAVDIIRDAAVKAEPSFLENLIALVDVT